MGWNQNLKSLYQITKRKLLFGDLQKKIQPFLGWDVYLRYICTDLCRLVFPFKTLLHLGQHLEEKFVAVLTLHKVMLRSTCGRLLCGEYFLITYNRFRFLFRDKEIQPFLLYSMWGSGSFIWFNWTRKVSMVVTDLALGSVNALQNLQFSFDFDFRLYNFSCQFRSDFLLLPLKVSCDP